MQKLLRSVPLIVAIPLIALAIVILSHACQIHPIPRDVRASTSGFSSHGTPISADREVKTAFAYTVLGLLVLYGVAAARFRLGLTELLRVAGVTLPMIAAALPVFSFCFILVGWIPVWTTILLVQRAFGMVDYTSEIYYGAYFVVSTWLCAIPVVSAARGLKSPGASVSGFSLILSLLLVPAAFSLPWIYDRAGGERREPDFCKKPLAISACFQRAMETGNLDDCPQLPGGRLTNGLDEPHGHCAKLCGSEGDACIERCYPQNDTFACVFRIAGNPSSRAVCEKMKEDRFSYTNAAKRCWAHFETK